MAANKSAVAVAVACACLLATFPAALVSAGGVDSFGVKEIYQTKPVGWQWFLNVTDSRDSFTISPAAAELYVNTDGSWQVERDSGYNGKHHSSVSVKPLKDRWVGIKMVAYNIGKSVKLELWVDDKADNNWVEIAETTYSGGWSSRANPALESRTT
jgi:hypothetical protein